MLSREGCEKALEQIEEAYYNSDNCFSALEGFSRNVELFYRLIHEHFDNPPLKFEELEVGKPYWDNLKECWFIVTEYDPTSYCKYKEINWYLDKNDACYLENIYENEFDENRYYRKQVEE